MSRVKKGIFGTVGALTVLLLAVAFLLIMPTIGSFVVMLVVGILHGSFISSVPAWGFATIWKLWVLIALALFAIALIGRLAIASFIALVVAAAVACGLGRHGARR